MSLVWLVYASKKSQLQNSFNWIEDYNGYNSITKEKKSFDWFSSLFKTGFFKWQWRVSLVLHWPARCQTFLGGESSLQITNRVAHVLSMTKSQKEIKTKLELSKFKETKSFNSLFPPLLSTNPLSIVFLTIYRGFQGYNCPLESLHNGVTPLITWVTNLVMGQLQ